MPADLQAGKGDGLDVGGHDGALRAAVEANPRDLEALRELVELLLASGQVAAGEELARRGVRHSPAASATHRLLASCLAVSARPAEAAWHYKRSLVLADDRDLDTVVRLACCLRDAGDLPAACDLFRAVSEALPNEPGPLIMWAEVEEIGRDFKAATALLKRAAALPQTAQTVRAATGLGATLRKRTGRLEEAAEALAPLAARATPCGTRARLERGLLLARLGQHEEAFAEISAAKADFVSFTGHSYQADAAQAWADNARAFFTPGNMALLPTAPVRPDTPQPIFVIGFPRSGTTLLEQSLSSHPEIAAAGETGHLLDLSDRVPGLLGSPLAFPEALSELWMAHGTADVGLLRDFYLGRATHDGDVQANTRWFTDKQNSNVGLVGLIATAFPESPIVHMIRHPLDAVLSAYSLTLGAGGFYALDLVDVAEFYALVADLTDDLLERCTTRCLTVRYEDVVVDQETTMRRVLEHVGVPFDPSVLSFATNPRYTRNESYAQVAEPLYTRAAGRYRHYLRHLEGVLPILMPAMERRGYRV